MTGFLFLSNNYDYDKEMETRQTAIYEQRTNAKFVHDSIRGANSGKPGGPKAIPESDLPQISRSLASSITPIRHPLEPHLPPRLVYGNRHGVGKVQAAHRR
jgi:hypothetical protein